MYAYLDGRCEGTPECSHIEHINILPFPASIVFEFLRSEICYVEPRAIRTRISFAKIASYGVLSTDYSDLRRPLCWHSNPSKSKHRNVGTTLSEFSLSASTRLNICQHKRLSRLGSSVSNGAFNEDES